MKRYPMLLNAATAFLLLASAGCSRTPKPREVVIDTTLEGKGGIYAPNFGFLFLETEERDQYALERNSSEAELDIYRGIVLQGLESEAPRSILARRKLAATTSLLLAQKGSSLAMPLVQDLFHYDYAVCQGLLREGREDLFGGARGWQSGGVVALPLWTAGAAAPDEDWALLYLENGALATLPRPGLKARPIATPMAAGTTKRGGDQVVQVALGAKGALVAELRRSGTLDAVVEDGSSLFEKPLKAWDMAWHPSIPLLYVTSPRGLEIISISGGKANKAACALPGKMTASALSASPDGTTLLLYPAGGASKLLSLPLNAEGKPGGKALLLPSLAASASCRAWEPSSHVLWCFKTDSGQAWRVDASTGKVLGSWSWPKERATLEAMDTGEGPTVTLRYSAGGYPSWQRFTAFLDPQSLKFVGLSEPSPVSGITWRKTNGLPH
ncbi:MAG: hypothetical protein JHC34_04110 [Acidobacteria bacterium]|nr:hypothetical protein [Acidobacteriota bacterium]